MESPGAIGIILGQFGYSKDDAFGGTTPLQLNLGIWEKFSCSKICNNEVSLSNEIFPPDYPRYSWMQSKTVVLWKHVVEARSERDWPYEAQECDQRYSACRSAYESCSLFKPSGDYSFSSVHFRFILHLNRDFHHALLV